MLTRGVHILHKIEDGLLVFILFAMIIMGFSQIILRNLFDTGIVLIDPVLRTLVLWIGLLGALVASRHEKQISVDVLTRILPAGLKLASFVITRAFAAMVSALIAWHSWIFVYDEWQLGTRAFASVPAWLTEIIIPFGFTIIALRYAIQIALALAHRPIGED
jgi:TRAP-type C4-dicarboxylate transport system permease small subunit